MTRIAVDAMGGDYAPSEIVKGAVWAAQDYNVPIELVGKIDEIQKVLDEIEKKGIRSNRGGYFVKNIKVDLSKLDIKLTQADEIIEMGEAPGVALRKKKNSSIVLAIISAQEIPSIFLPFAFIAVQAGQEIPFNWSTTSDTFTPLLNAREAILVSALRFA